jgi:hypothetical protein
MACKYISFCVVEIAKRHANYAVDSLYALQLKALCSVPQETGGMYALSFLKVLKKLSKEVINNLKMPRQSI